jgi:hypothetical protein
MKLITFRPTAINSTVLYHTQYFVVVVVIGLNLHSLNVFTLGSSWKSFFLDLIISTFQAVSMFAAMLTLDLFGVTLLSSISTIPLQPSGEILNIEATGNFLRFKIYAN